MEFRIKETARTVTALCILAPALLAQQEFTYQARHSHLRKNCAGVLRIEERGVSYVETASKKRKHPHEWHWTYPEIQQLEIGPHSLRVLTYLDNKWKMGADREYRFEVPAADLSPAYQALKARLDQRFVAALPDADVAPLWSIPVKRLGRISGSQGTLLVGEDRIVYRTERPRESRTWRYSDIDNISSSGPFQLTLTTYERALAHYGSMKGFNFQLKEPLPEGRYNDLWRRLNAEKGLKILVLNQKEKH